jgi:hypothetical protein
MSDVAEILFPVALLLIFTAMSVMTHIHMRRAKRRKAGK